METTELKDKTKEIKDLNKSNNNSLKFQEKNPLKQQGNPAKLFLKGIEKKLTSLTSRIQERLSQGANLSSKEALADGKYLSNLANAAKKAVGKSLGLSAVAAEKTAGSAKEVGKGIEKGAKAVSQGVVAGANVVGKGALFVGALPVVGAVAAGQAAVKGAKTIGKEVKAGAKTVGQAAKKGVKVVEQEFTAVGKKVTAGAKAVGKGALFVGSLPVVGAIEIGKAAKKVVEAFGQGVVKRAETAKQAVSSAATNVQDKVINTVNKAQNTIKDLRVAAAKEIGGQNADVTRKQEGFRNPIYDLNSVNNNTYYNNKTNTPNIDNNFTANTKKDPRLFELLGSPPPIPPRPKTKSETQGANPPIIPPRPGSDYSAISALDNARKIFDTPPAIPPRHESQKVTNKISQDKTEKQEKYQQELSKNNNNIDSNLNKISTSFSEGMNVKTHQDHQKLKRSNSFVEKLDQQKVRDGDKITRL